MSDEPIDPRDLDPEELKENGTQGESEPEADEAEKAADPEEPAVSKSKFKEMVTRGHTYREDYEFEMLGETTTIQLQPLRSDVYRKVREVAKEDVDNETFARILKRKREGSLEEEIESDDPDEDLLSDMIDMQAGQEGALKLAAKYGIDPDSVDLDSREEVAKVVDKMPGMKPLLIGYEVMSITSDVGAADDFPGSRGR